MANLVRRESTGLNCACCGERVRKCETFVQVVDHNGDNVRGERYCLSCEDIAHDNNSESPIYREDIQFITGSNGVEHARNAEGEWLY